MRLAAERHAIQPGVLRVAHEPVADAHVGVQQILLPNGGMNRKGGNDVLGAVQDRIRVFSHGVSIRIGHRAVVEWHLDFQESLSEEPFRRRVESGKERRKGPCLVGDGKVPQLLEASGLSERARVIDDGEMGVRRCRNTKPHAGGKRQPAVRTLVVQTFQDDHHVIEIGVIAAQRFSWRRLHAKQVVSAQIFGNHPSRRRVGIGCRSGNVANADDIARTQGRDDGQAHFHRHRAVEERLLAAERIQVRVVMLRFTGVDVDLIIRGISREERVGLVSDAGDGLAAVEVVVAEIDPVLGKRAVVLRDRRVDNACTPETEC